MTTYSDFQDNVRTLVDRSTAVLPNTTIDLLVNFAESRIYRELRIRNLFTSTTLSTVSGTDTVSLPEDYEELRSISHTSGGASRTLTLLSPEELIKQYGRTGTGAPKAYSIEGFNLVIGPTPDSVYSLIFKYFQKEGVFSNDFVPSLFVNEKDIFYFATAKEAADFVEDSDRSILYDKKFIDSMNELSNSDLNSKYSGGPLTIQGIKA